LSATTSSSPSGSDDSDDDSGNEVEVEEGTFLPSGQYHAATQTTQWHYPTSTEARDPAIAKMRADHNTQDAHSRRLS
jgi:hypothetical protein